MFIVFLLIVKDESLGEISLFKGMFNLLNDIRCECLHVIQMLFHQF